MSSRIIPDGVEPVIGLRLWFVNGYSRRPILYGYTSCRWPAGRALQSSCSRQVWQRHELHASLGWLAWLWHSFKIFGVMLLPPALLLLTPLSLFAQIHCLIRDRHLGRHDESLAEQCSCGIYSLKPSCHANDRLLDYSVEHAVIGELPIFGKVAQWGQVIVGENGYRSQFGYPTELFIASGDHWLLPSNSNGDRMNVLRSRLEERYGVPVSIYEGDRFALLTELSEGRL